MQPPPASGVRLQWSELPLRVQHSIEAWLGAPVASVRSQPGGFSPGVAARIQAANGRRVFFKATSPAQNPDSPKLYRREARIVAELPTSVPVPRLLWSLDEGADGWVVLAFEDIDGRNPALPWHREELERVLDAMASLAATLTPSPIEAPTARERFVRFFQCWQRMVAAPPPHLDAWSARHRERLAALETEAVAAVAGDTLLHFDTRADNLILTPDRVYVVDWPHACVGAAWVDLIGFAPSVAMQGGPQPEELLASYPPGLSAPADAITAVVAAIAGYFTWGALQPPPPGLPTVRAFQAAQGVVARAWLTQRTGWT
jgi:aminoglycoside phosphotransferase (APT) family kinase protein